MDNDGSGQEFSKTSPLRKAGYVTVATVATAFLAPFAFGINTFSWILSYMTENWPQLIIIAVFVGWFGKSHFGG